MPTDRHNAAPRSPRRILHVVARSVPHLNGYTVRTACIVDTQRARGLEPAVITSPYYPGLPASLEDADFAGTPHRRVRHPLDEHGRLTTAERLTRPLHRRRMAIAEGGPRLLRPFGTACAGAEEMLLMRRFERAIVSAGRDLCSEIVHAHSPYRCALPSIGAARRLRVPVVYEVRGLWEETAVAEGTLRRDGLAYRMCRRRELNAMRAADAVVVISDALRAAIVERGVSADRVVVSPNAVDPEAFRPPVGAAPAAVTALREQLAGPVIGYVGSLRRLEGIDELLRGAATLLAGGERVWVLVVGDGPELPALRALADQLGLGAQAVFTGQVPREEVPWYYGLIDVFAVTRPSLPVTELVPPLKPLEAMALGRPVIVSDLRPLRELVRDGETGLVYAPGDPADLAAKAKMLLQDEALRERLSAAARAWVEREQSWSATLRVLDEAYARAAERRSAARR